MDDNNLNKIDELLESTSAERRIKFNINEIEAVDGPQIEDPAPSFANIENTHNTEEVDSVVAKPEPIAKKPETEEAKSEPVQPQQNICIIDETSTTVVFEQGPDLTANEIHAVAEPTDVVKKKGPKQPVKFSVIQIIAMVVVGIIALWSVMFTVDHVLAVNGTTPVFCVKKADYENGSMSFKGLGYKVQFTFDNNGNLSQSCDPFWKDGPNDARTDLVS